DDVANTTSASTLLVDGRAPASSDGAGGSIRQAEFWLDGAYIVVEGSAAYRSLGVKRAERHVLIHFDALSNDLLLNTLDRVEADRPHSYTWQMNLGEPNETRRVVRDRRLTPIRNQAFVF